MLKELLGQIRGLAVPKRGLWAERKQYLKERASHLNVPGDDILRDVDLIAWERLEHAYGPATDVPDCLRIAAYGSDEDREDARSELESNIFHQYTVYPATPFAVPFLLRMVSAEWMPDRLWLLDYLGSLAEASDSLRGTPPPGTPTVREAVSVGLPTYRAFMTSEDKDIHEAHGRLVSRCVEGTRSPDWWRSSPVIRGR